MIGGLLSTYRLKIKLFTLILIMLTSMTTLFILDSYCHLSVDVIKGTLQPSIKIPKLTNEEIAKIATLEHLELASSLKTQSLENYLSNIIQSQIARIQRKSCQEPNMECGHQDVCGVGCQLHHRIACLMISYATNLPIIHTVDYDAWPYSGTWSDVFRPLGSNCRLSRNTYTWSWLNYAGESGKCHNLIKVKGRPAKIRDIPFRLNLGIPIESKLVDILETQNLDPFHWIVGQFTKYAMTFTDKFLNELKNWKAQVGFFDNMTIVGLQIRRTDKPDEYPESHHEIQDYMAAVELYFANSSSTKEKAVFIASDDKSILTLARKMYPTWKFIGFESNLSTPNNRTHGLFEIMRDISLLSDCDHIVCGLTSNVCRLLQEMLSFKRVQSSNMLTSLDGSYRYVLLGRMNSIDMNMKLWKIE